MPESYAISQIKARISVRRLDALHVETLATAFKDAAAGGAGIVFLAVRHFMARVCSSTLLNLPTRACKPPPHSHAPIATPLDGA